MNQTVERGLVIAYPLVRVLAPLDALLLHGAVLAWVMSWPASGGLVGAVVGVFCLWRGIVRAYGAVFHFEQYRWMTLRLAKCAIVLGVTMVLFKLVWIAQG